MKEKNEGNLLIKEVIIDAQKRKLESNWEGPYRIYQKLPHKAYKLQELEGLLYLGCGTHSIFDIIIV